MRRTACNRGSASQQKVAIITVGNWFSDNLPPEMPLSTWAVKSPPILPYTGMIILRAGLTEWKKTQVPNNRVILFEDHREMLHTQAFLFAGGTSVNRWQSLSSSCEAQSRNAEAHLWLLQLLPALSSQWDMVKVGWSGRRGRCPAGIRAPGTRDLLTWGKMSNLKPSEHPSSPCAILPVCSML